ncbi:tryptophan synthase beta subunit-like PLP-dependent enzyme [Pluteus cervinus]|uniref:Tryptophan synthase beta subunit-like PLP-dependent enzyme n=1 Tax=Pluteus cervinus TaxID=181527 RepID=A0ACD3B3C1_9AGAR|nr:tryptophan synthase beta subunit-like PLP-dependent enzyme [Pluteus cervinus]
MPLWQETPLIYSNRLSERLAAHVYLKLENLHPSCSFKYRGVSLFVERAKEKHGTDLHLVIASGGNAGLAAACAARVLNVRCTVYIPEGVAERTLFLLKQEGANVVVRGRVYAKALEAALENVKQESNAVMVPAYDDPVLWEGHGSIVDEVERQLRQKPDALFCSVGGGGLLGGLIIGCERKGWDDVKIVALETIGSDCFYHSMALNKGTGVTLPVGITRVRDERHGVDLAHFDNFTSKAAGSLGASQPSSTVIKMALQRSGGVQCVTIPDQLSMQAAVRFTEDHRMLVELACSTTLSPAYKTQLFEKVVPSSTDKKTVVFIVCGGFKTSLDDMVEYRKTVEDDVRSDQTQWEVWIDGKCVKVDKK